MKGRRGRGRGEGRGKKKNKSDERWERKRHGWWQSENETLKKDCIKKMCSVREKNRTGAVAERCRDKEEETDRDRGTVRQG